MARSNVPQALSVVGVTHEGDVQLTASEIVKFDGKKLFFSHDRTWACTGAALSGRFPAESVLAQFARVHPRVAKSIAAICELGQSAPRSIMQFRDHPGARMREVEPLRFGPDVSIMVKATCWYVEDGRPVLPILQPRADGLSPRKLAVYAALARRAYCRGAWLNAEIEIVDLSQSDKDGTVVAEAIRASSLPPISEDQLNAFLQTYVEGRIMAEEIRATYPEKTKEPRAAPLLELLASKSDEP